MMAIEPLPAQVFIVSVSKSNIYSNFRPKERGAWPAWYGERNRKLESLRRSRQNRSLPVLSSRYGMREVSSSPGALNSIVVLLRRVRSLFWRVPGVDRRMRSMPSREFLGMRQAIAGRLICHLANSGAPNSDHGLPLAICVPQGAAFEERVVRSYRDRKHGRRQAHCLRRRAGTLLLFWDSHPELCTVHRESRSDNRYLGFHDSSRLS